MSAARLSVLRIFLLFAILSRSACLYGQRLALDGALDWGPVIDTSGYIPSFYAGALDYNLMIAASKGYASEIERIIGEGADINAETDEGATPLIFAVTNNRLAAVKTLLNFNPLLDKVTTSFETPLLIAVKNRNFEITEALIRAGSEVDYPDRQGATPLHHASINGYLDIVDLLLYYGASIDVKSEEGTTPLLASIWAEYTDVADLLIQNGANMEARDNDGFTPFLMAAFNGDTLMMDLLYKKGVDIYATNISHQNALTLSILADRRGAAAFLLRIGDKWTNSGRGVVNPYSVASKYRRKEMVNILEKNNVRGQLKYEIDQVGLTASSRFCLHDLYTGVSLSFKEPFLNEGFIIGFDMKLWYTRVLIKDSGHLFYQYLDKGSVAYAGLFKDFALTDRLYRSNFAFSTSLLAGYSFGNKLKGTLITPENKFMVIPAISFKWTKKNLSISLGMEYMKTEYYHVGPVWLRIGSSYSLFFDNIRTKAKTIKWY
ncbi:MAG: ankyrin repeat domain-containing protein [Bacteroidia bacterium]|nr:ankyrin repeat domain-containing protein [Bacteroidia bacterium]